ncbi:MAG: acyltransferase [Methylococcales bacterium]|nr:acyltransferase [Methylococcales bacterium]
MLSNANRPIKPMSIKEISRSAKIDSLQAIRGFAATGVMLAHGSSMLDERLGYLFLNNLSMVGASGVDVFFVLSGFIILYTSSSGQTTFGNFLKRRFIRIYPIYWIVTAMLIIQYQLAPTLAQAHKGELPVVLGSITLFPQPKYVVGVAWTLTYEVLFYLVFALTYFKSPRLFAYAAGIWAVLILLVYGLDLKIGIYALDALSNPIILEFLFGCILAYVFKRFPDFRHSRWFFWSGLMLLLLMWGLYYQNKTSIGDAFFDEMARVYYFGIPAACLIFGALYLSGAVPRVLVFLGDASYSLYLIHGTILSLLLKLVFKFNLQDSFAGFAGALALFAGTLLISGLFYRLLEKRLLGRLNRLFVTNRAPKPVIETG